LAPLQGFTAESLRAPARALGLLPKRGHARAFRGYGPLSRLPSLGERHRTAVPTPRCLEVPSAVKPRAPLVAPSGFRTLSTLCSPPDLPGLFHPGPASGVHPTRLCSAVSAVQISRPARTLLRFLTLCRIAFDPRTGGMAMGPASPGLCSPTAASQRRLGIAPYAAAVASVGLVPPRYARASFAGLSARFPSRALLTYRCERARARCRR
jgi:hypothetical protein